ncbi:FecR domain-containing protein [Flavitalea sp. BT771]|uniref:FecR family protein n=1 Tax=Flavitalea sp. BT771 TaxID=3063329 RepID=UPI0026E46BEF|nr:FecR family protein [Flavitalea sp. BT771]MDO6433878.1 FecR domain-containing protein [Flavitalea sp. BT771]MDV6222217.1 FecR domain-containing protein [Flavitalea sp. BT771]
MSDELNYIERIAGLIIKFHNDEITQEEYQELMDWRQLSDENRVWFDKLSDPDYLRGRVQKFSNLQSLKKAGWEKVISAIDEEDLSVQPAIVRPMHRTRYFVAASLVGLLAVGAWLYTRNRPVATSDASPALTSTFKNDVAPGGNKAILTLSDGSNVVLDSAGKGTIAHQGIARVVKLDDGKLAYNNTGSEKPAALAYNTLTTPAAGQFQLLLPDGTKVWLNNASSLRYPVAFTGKDREVELKGEAYFEIAPNARQPFKVKVNEGTQVDVLGTSFNISAYTDETTIKTTLLSGAVRISRGDARKILKPGQQARMNESGSLETLDDVDTDGVVAWKNGLFHFERADIKTAMRMLARWYNVEVVYEGAIPNRTFGGDMERKLNLSEVLKILEKNEVHFDIEGRKLTVRP